MPQATDHHTLHAQAHRPVKPDEEVGTGYPGWPSGGMTALEDPSLPRLDLAAEARLLLVGSLNPVRLPVNVVDVDDRQARARAERSGQCALA
jgi:hypothetical protein